jgi:uncharacterized membrane protein
VTGFDGRLLALNLFYLSWIVLIPFSSQVLGDHGGDRAAIVLYAANLAGVILVGRLMFDDALRAGLATTDEQEMSLYRRRSLFIAGIFLVSIPIAFYDAHLAQFLWIALFLEPLVRRARGD